MSDASRGNTSATTAWLRALEMTTPLSRNRRLTFPVLIDDLAGSFGSSPALLREGECLTYEGLAERVHRYARWALHQHSTAGDVVCLLLQSSTKFAACYAGMLRVGAIASAINPRLGVAERTSIFARTTPALTVLGDGLAVPEVADAGAVLPVSELKEAFAVDPPARFPRLDPSDPTCIVWTSGTTGAPKGAVYDHAAQQAIARNIVGLAAMGDRRLWVTPMPHVGYMTRFYHEIAHASTLVLVLEPWSPEEALEAIERERVTVATGVPTLFLTSDEDGVIWPELSQKVHEHVAGSRFERVEAAGHSTYFERPDVFNREVGAFLKGYRP